MTNAEPVVGAWWSQCCPLDTYPIETEEDISDVREMLADDEIADSVRVWPTFDDAWRYWTERGTEDAESLSDLWARRPTAAH